MSFDDERLLDISRWTASTILNFDIGELRSVYAEIKSIKRGDEHGNQLDVNSRWEPFVDVRKLIKKRVEGEKQEGMPEIDGIRRHRRDIPAEVLTKAKEILASRNVQDYLLELFQKPHFGDELVFLLYSAARVLRYISNGNMYYIQVNGGYNKGKSDAIELTQSLLGWVPVGTEEYRAMIVTGMTDKVIWYLGLPDGLIIHADDKKLSTDYHEMTRGAYGKNKASTRLALNTDREVLYQRVPANTVFASSFVERQYRDEQEISRYLYVDVKRDSVEQRRNVWKKVIAANACKEDVRISSDEYEVVDAIWAEIDRITPEPVQIPVPEELQLCIAHDVDNDDEIRQYNILMTLAISRAFYRTLQTGEERVVTREDMSWALDVFTKTAPVVMGSDDFYFTDTQRAILEYCRIHRRNAYTFEEVIEGLGMHKATFSIALKGRKDKDGINDGSGILARTTELEIETDTEDRRKKYLKWNGVSAIAGRMYTLMGSTAATNAGLRETNAGEEHQLPPVTGTAGEHRIFCCKLIRKLFSEGY